MKVLVTGSSKGIGRACALLFLHLGHKVYGIDRLASTINHPKYTHYKEDIRTDIVHSTLIDIDILINNAGVQDSEDDIDINLNGTINVTEKYGIQPNIKSILFMASASASTGAEFPKYAASKGGMVAYMKNVALRIAQYGATSNSLSAGGVTTKLNQHIIEDKDLYRMVLEETMLNKWATAEEIADFTYFMTVINKSMTGQDILVDNGEALKSNFIW